MKILPLLFVILLLYAAGFSVAYTLGKEDQKKKILETLTYESEPVPGSKTTLELRLQPEHKITLPNEDYKIDVWIKDDGMLMIEMAKLEKQ